MPDPPRVVIIILTFNSAPHVRECLDSLGALEDSDFEIVVVDNASTDETVSLARQHPLTPTVIVNETNLGYAAGNNVGLHYALNTGADFALVLNDDVIVAPDLLTHLRVAAQQANVALLGPLIYHHSDPTIIQSAGGARTPGWEFYHRGLNMRDTGQFNQSEPVVWLSGCAVLARCQALNKIGLLDADFFMYWEDVDWCLRAWQAGYTVMFVPHAKVWHKGVQVAYDPAPRVAYYMARNELLLLRKHRAGWRVFLGAWLRHLRTVASYTVRPRWRARRAYRDATAQALHDFMRGQFGAALRLGKA